MIVAARPGTGQAPSTILRAGGLAALLATVPAASCRFACRADEIRAARNVITADRGGKSAAQEGDAAVAIEFGGPCSS
jgi:hypothetical protein